MSNQTYFGRGGFGGNTDSNVGQNSFGNLGRGGAQSNFGSNFGEKSFNNLNRFGARGGGNSRNNFDTGNNGSGRGGFQAQGNFGRGGTQSGFGSTSNAPQGGGFGSNASQSGGFGSTAPQSTAPGRGGSVRHFSSTPGTPAFNDTPGFAAPRPTPIEQQSVQQVGIESKIDTPDLNKHEMAGSGNTVNPAGSELFKRFQESLSNKDAPKMTYPIAVKEEPKIADSIVFEEVKQPEQPQIVKEVKQPEHSKQQVVKEEPKQQVTKEDIDGGLYRKKVYDAFARGFTGFFTFKVGDKSVMISEATFAVHSPAFEQLMRSGTEEAKTKVSHVNDLSLDSVDQFVRYVSYGDTERVQQFAEDILKLAEKFALGELKAICLQHISSRPLSKENIIQRLIEAFTRQDAKLKQTTIDFVTDNANGASFKSVMNTDEWRDFSIANRDLSDEIKNAVIAKLM